jgi:hypothetical protein
MIIAAIRSGTDPIAPLPPATFHRTLEDPITCPKCEATYMLVLDYDHAVARHFDSDARRHLTMLRKAVFLDHALDHRTTHFETNGIVVTSHSPTRPASLEPLTRLIN